MRMVKLVCPLALLGFVIASTAAAQGTEGPANDVAADVAGLLEHLTAAVLATGALGTAAFGIVEGLKWVRRLGEAGFPALERVLGAPLLALLQAAYGTDVVRVLRAQYRGDQRELT